MSSAVVLGGSLLAACQAEEFCADSECTMDDGGGESPTGGKTNSGGGAAAGGKASIGGMTSRGAGGEKSGSGGETLGGAAGAEASGGRPEGSGGMTVDPGELDASVAVELVDILAGGSATVVVTLERTRGFEGTVLVSLDGEPQFSGTQVFAAADDDEVTLTIEATGEIEQGYYDVAIVAESADGVLGVEIPLNIRVRGAPGSLDLTFGDRQDPWLGEGPEAEVAVDDAGFVYLRNQETIFRFDRHGQLDESFEPEGLGTQLGGMIGMEEGVLIGTRGPTVPDQLIHFLGTGERDPVWTGSGPTRGNESPLLQWLPYSLDRRAERVVVGADYYPQQYSTVQLFSAQGIFDAAFRDTRYLQDAVEGSLIARLDSQGRVLVTAKLFGAPAMSIRRLLADGSLDTTFADQGELVLAGTAPTVLNFEVLSEDGLVILLRDSSGARLAFWTPSEAGGIVHYNVLDESSFQHHALLRVHNDELVMVADNNGRFSFKYYAQLYSRNGIVNTSFGDVGAVNMNDLCEQHYASTPDPSGPCQTPHHVAFDSYANRLIAYGESGKTLFSIWL